MKTRQQRRQLAKKLRICLQQKAWQGQEYLGSKGRKRNKQQVRNQLLKAGYKDRTVSVPNGCKRQRVVMVEGKAKLILVEMVTCRNLVRNMTRKILKMPVKEIQRFLSLDPAMLAPQKNQKEIPNDVNVG